MAWTYFTSYLDGTRPIRKAERDELFDQLALNLPCPPRYSVNATALTAVKTSLLTTDRLQLDDTLGSPITGRLESVLAAISSTAFVNYAAARAAALASESLTETDLTAILGDSVDAYRLWNFYKRWIDNLIPSAPAPTFRYRTSSATKTKYGFNEYGTLSSPPKFYRKETVHREHSLCTSTNPTEFCPDDCCTRIVDFTNDYDSAGIASYENDYTETGCPSNGYLCGFFLGYDTKDWRIYYETGGGCCVGGGYYSNLLSDEYTTAQLIAAVDAALPAYSGSFNTGTTSAIYTVLTDETQVAKRGFEYKFVLPDLTGCTSYRLDWTMDFTSGGITTPVAMYYVWDGIATETPVYTVAPPSTTAEVITISTPVASA
jgi:hypothetical protein